MKRVIGIGNALTDMLVNLKSDSVLSRFKLAKGSMSLVDTTLQTEISKSVAGLPYSLSLGGSAGNTIRAMAKLGCQVGFIGKVGQDTTGDFFVQALENLGVEPVIFRGSKRSGKCVSLISPDGERTMVTYLGAALELTAAEIDPAIFDGYDCLYIEGYIVQDHDLIRMAARTAKECGLKVAIDLASFNIVAENLEFLRNLVRDYVDIVFANEDEAKTFTCEGEYSGRLQNSITPLEQFFYCLCTGITVVQARLKDCHLHFSKFIQRSKRIYRSEAIAHKLRIVLRTDFKLTVFQIAYMQCLVGNQQEVGSAEASFRPAFTGHTLLYKDGRIAA